VPRRFRLASRLTLWAFAAALVLKSAVPLLAAAAAGLQGKEVADICAIYGVRLASASGHADHAAAAAPAMSHMDHVGHMGHVGQIAGMDVPATGGDHDSHHEPADPAAHAQDHCALTALGTIAVDAPTAWAGIDRLDRDSVPTAGRAVETRAQDASARWLTLRLHAPPPSA
jgi:hypothetical protein